MNFYVYQKGQPKNIQLTEDEIFEILREYSGVIFARNQEDIDYLSSFKLMYGIDVYVGSYIGWAASRQGVDSLPQPLPQYMFSLEPIPY